MADKCVWTGASGTKYTFYVYPRHPRIIAGQMGNYIYAKIDQTSNWQPIYIGQGDISVRCTKSPYPIECINSKGATHVHLKVTRGPEIVRKYQERDLLATHPEAYAPTGCNQREGASSRAA